jgi:hypothetical protein
MDNIEIKMLRSEEFKQISEELHRSVFFEERARELERIDFACLFFYQKRLGGYVTCYEHDSEQLYIQFGGAMPEFRSSSMVYVAYSKMIKILLKKYSFLLTMVENENIPMLKLAFKCGWIIIGTRMTTDKKLLVELINWKRDIS